MALHRKPRGGSAAGGAGNGVPTVDVLPSRVDALSEIVGASSGSKGHHARKLALAMPIKQQRMSTTQLRTLCAACLLVYLAALCFAEDIVRLGAAIRSDAARQRLFSPWRPVRSAVTAAVAATRPLLRVAPAPTTDERDDDGAEEDTTPTAAETATLAVGEATATQRAAEESVSPSKSAERVVTVAGTAPPTPAAAAPAELERAKEHAKEHKSESEVAEDDSFAPVLDEVEAVEKAEAAEPPEVKSAETPEAAKLRSPPSVPAVSDQDLAANRAEDGRRSPPSEAFKSEDEKLTSTGDKTPLSLGEHRSPPSDVVGAGKDAVTGATAVVPVSLSAPRASSARVGAAATAATLSSAKSQAPSDVPGASASAVEPNSVLAAAPAELAVAEEAEKAERRQPTEHAAAAARELARR